MDVCTSPANLDAGTVLGVDVCTSLANLHTGAVLGVDLCTFVVNLDTGAVLGVHVCSLGVNREASAVLGVDVCTLLVSVDTCSRLIPPGPSNMKPKKQSNTEPRSVYTNQKKTDLLHRVDASERPDTCNDQHLPYAAHRFRLNPIRRSSGNRQASDETNIFLLCFIFVSESLIDPNLVLFKYEI